MTVGLLLPKLNLKNKTKIKTISNIVPDCWVYVQDRSVPAVPQNRAAHFLNLFCCHIPQLTRAEFRIAEFFDKRGLYFTENMGLITTLQAGFSYLAALLHRRKENSLYSKNMEYSFRPKRLM